MVTQYQIQAFQRDGYLHGGRLLGDAQVDELRAELDRVIARHDHGYSERVYIDDTAAFCQSRDCFFQVTNLRQLSDTFRVLAESPVLVDAAHDLLGEPSLLLFADSLLFKRGQNSAVNDWHQDGLAFDILSEPTAVTAWIALDDVGEDDGCVCFARGSHLWTDDRNTALPRLNEMLARNEAEHPPITEDDRGINEYAGIHRSLARAGEVHFHHGLTWHCSLENKTGKPRRAFAVFYIPATTRFVASGQLYMKPFIESADGEPIAGRHFPLVRRSCEATASTLS
jgi:ectoine hydroxylase-related dioxygenase (phytanoyl-CoA dioxygenase family)